MAKKLTKEKTVGRNPITDGTKKVQFSFYIQERVLNGLGKDACRVYCTDLLNQKYESLPKAKK